MNTINIQKFIHNCVGRILMIWSLLGLNNQLSFPGKHTLWKAILTPVLSDDQMKEAVNKFRGILTDNGAEILNEENWGLKKLAYAIEKKSTGFYVMVEFKAAPEVIKTLEINYRRDERVLRYLTVKMEKYAAEYAEKRRSNKSKKED